MDITVAIDKIDKIGLDAVKAELAERGIDEKGIATIEPVLVLSGTTEEKLATMKGILAGSEAGLKGLAELEELFGYISVAGIKQEVEIDLSLARGLNYYTGAIFEVKAKDFVFAIERILDARTHSPYYNDFSNIQSIVATGDYSLKIQLKTPDFNFTEKLAMAAAYPCCDEFFATCGGAYGLSVDNILSNGPFKLNYLDGENGNATIVSTREDDSNRLSRIRLVQMAADSQAKGYENDEIDYYDMSGLATGEEITEKTSNINRYKQSYGPTKILRYQWYRYKK